MRTTPRSAQVSRPLVQGLVVGAHRSRIEVQTRQRRVSVPVSTSKHRIVVGDQVVIHDADSPNSGVQEVLPRSNLLVRSKGNNDTRPIAANVDPLVVVFAPKPQYSTDLIDRYLVVAETSSMVPILVLNKSDLLTDGQRAEMLADLEIYTRIGYEAFTISVKTGDGLAALSWRLASRQAVLVGQSGAGKSSLGKRLTGDHEIATGALSERRGHGRHTTSASRLHPLVTDGYLIDTPGVRDCALWHVPENDIASGFREFLPLLGQCRFGDCRHLDEPDCALTSALVNGTVSVKRYQSYRRLRETYTDD